MCNVYLSTSNKKEVIMTDESIGDLLTIKQAAKMLNVSEMSLRRWTNDGKLACLRVGAHRNRRFRQADLDQFLEKQHVSSPPTKKPIHTKQISKAADHVLLEGIAIEYGNHLCSFYDNVTGCEKLAVPLIADGLRQGDVCFLIAPPKTQKILLDALAKANCNYKAAIDNGQLLVSDGQSNKIFIKMLHGCDAVWQSVHAFGRGHVLGARERLECRRDFRL